MTTPIAEQLIIDHGVATQFVFNLSKKMKIIDAYAIGHLSTEMMIRRNIEAESTIHLEELNERPYEGRLVLTISGERLDYEAFIIANVVTALKQKNEYIGAVVRYAE